MPRHVAAGARLKRGGEDALGRSEQGGEPAPHDWTLTDESPRQLGWRPSRIGQPARLIAAITKAANQNRNISAIGVPYCFGTGHVNGETQTRSPGGRAMRTKTTARLKTMAVSAAIVSVMLTALPAFASWGTDCEPAICTSPVVGPGYVQDVETR